MRLIIAMLTLLSVTLQGEEAPWNSPHSPEAEENAPAALIPFPREVVWGKGEWKMQLPPGWRDVARTGRIGEKDGRMLDVAWSGFFSDARSDSSLSPGERSSCFCLELARVPGLPAEGEEEGYQLVVNAGGVRLTAPRPAGLFNGLQTLRQLAAGGHSSLPYCEILDWPAFKVRGFHEDCGRNFRSIERLKKEIGLASRLKLNYFHWHLTDFPAWHVQCKAYPQLNAPEHRTRDLHDTYSYDQIRELIAFARDRNITIIPELDMPGHSAYFDKAFGFPMHSERGMQVLETVIREFCAEVPAEDCPIFHIGADEIQIPHAKEFVVRMSKLLLSLGRTPMQWGGPNDLPVGEFSIAQRWGDGADLAAKSLRAETIHCRTIDSSPGYANLFDPSLLVRRWFFLRPCGVAKGDDQKLGAIFCIWPDMRVDDKSCIPLYNAVWPGICAMAERSWNGGAGDGDAFPADMPPPDTEPGRAFALFEKRMEQIRHSIFADEPFPYHSETGQKWLLVGPVPEARKEEVRAKALAGDYSGLPVRVAHGASLYFRTRPNTGRLGMFADSEPGECIWAVRKVHAEQAEQRPYFVGFDAPARSVRRWSGIPLPGEWSRCGTKVWVNGREFKNPRRYELAGKNRHERDPWSEEINEIPLVDEEVWWALSPTPFPLQKGENTIIVEQPYIGLFQTWSISIIPAEE